MLAPEIFALETLIQLQPLISWSWNLVKQFILMTTFQQQQDILQILSSRMLVLGIFALETLAQPQPLME